MFFSYNGLPRRDPLQIVSFFFIHRSCLSSCDHNLYFRMFVGAWKLSLFVVIRSSRQFDVISKEFRKVAFTVNYAILIFNYRINPNIKPAVFLENKVAAFFES